MNIDSIQNGVVIDHIQAGQGMKLYRRGHHQNADSGKMGKKDIIKIDAGYPRESGYRGLCGSRRHREHHPQRQAGGEAPDAPVRWSVQDVIACKNPRCITSTEQELHHDLPPD